MSTYLWILTALFVILVLLMVMYILIRETDQYYAAFKGVLLILAGAIGSNAILPYIAGTTSLDIQFGNVLTFHAPNLMIKINPPDTEDMDKTRTLSYMTWLASLSLVLMLINNKFRP